MNTPHNWSYLRQKVQEWSAGEMLHPSQDEGRQQHLSGTKP